MVLEEIFGGRGACIGITSGEDSPNGYLGGHIDLGGGNGSGIAGGWVNFIWDYINL